MNLISEKRRKCAIDSVLAILNVPYFHTYSTVWPCFGYQPCERIVFLLKHTSALSLSLSAACMYPSLALSQSTLCTAKKKTHITQQLSILGPSLSPPLSVFVCSASSGPAPSFYSSLGVIGW